MTTITLVQGAGTAATAVAVGRALAFATVTVAASVLAYYLTVYVREILVSPYDEEWWYLAVGVGAAVVYGLSGLAEVTDVHDAAGVFRVGATLFFFLFSAVGVRALYATAKVDRGGDASLYVPAWAVYAVIGAFVVAWWGAYLSGVETAVAVVETVGLAVAATYTLAFAVLTVREAEGTSIAAVIRQFVPALVTFAGIVVAEQVAQYTDVSPGAVTGVVLVGTVLVGAFLFTTAVAIRQQGSELHRLYDQTTWRQQELE